MPATTSKTSDAAAREQEKTKLLLIRQINILEGRKAAIDNLIEEKKAELRLLMAGDGDRKKSSPDGDAEFGTRRSFKVIDYKSLMSMFSKQTLAENFSPKAAFIDAAIKAGKDIEKAVRIAYDETFKVSRPKGREAKKQHELLIERAKKEAADNVKKLTAKIRHQSDPSKDKE